MAAPLKRRLRFRIRVSPARFIRVSISETQEDMWSAIQDCHGARHEHEKACTVFAPGSPDRGCVADLFFYWRGLRPSVIAHEASHASWAVATALKEPVGLTEDEFQAMWVEKIVDKIWLRTQMAAL